MTHPGLEPGRLGPLELRNRIVKTATFEGMTPGGKVTDELIGLHAGLAARGVALTTLAYGAVAPEGRTFPDQLVLDEASLPDLRRLTDAVHAHGGAASVQLAHCGGFSRDTSRTPAGPSHGFNAYGVMLGLPCVRAMTEDDLRSTIDAFAKAAALAKRAGFDAVEVHCGHGYLLSQFLSPAINRRRDRWGRNAEGRARLAVEVVRAVREAVGPDVAIVAKINLRDGIRGGLEPDGAVDAARRLVAAGIDAIQPSCGLVNRTPFLLLRGRTPVREMIAAEHHPLQRWALRLAGPVILRDVPYRSTFLMDDAVGMLGLGVPVILLGGVDSAAAIATARARGFDFVAMGRALIADPDFVERLARGKDVVTRCIHCNVCVAEMERSGVRCIF